MPKQVLSMSSSSSGGSSNNNKNTNNNISSSSSLTQPSIRKIGCGNVTLIVVLLFFAVASLRIEKFGLFDLSFDKVRELSLNCVIDDSRSSSSSSSTSRQMGLKCSINKNDNPHELSNGQSSSNSSSSNSAVTIGSSADIRSASPLPQPLSSSSSSSSSSDNNKINNNNRLFEFLTPLKTCNVLDLQFDPSKHYIQSVPSYNVIKNDTACQDNGTCIGYGPHISKCASSSSTQMLQYFAEHMKGRQYTTLPTTFEIQPLVDDDVINKYTFFSFIRHPIERALAGIHQFEVFLRMGWINNVIQKYNLTWWDTACIDSLYGINHNPGRVHKFNCTGSIPSRSNRTKLQRLSNILQDMEDYGFFDQHITPLTYIIAQNPITKLHAKKAYIFDIHDSKKVYSAIGQRLNVDMPPELHAMERPNIVNTSDPMGMHWTVHRTDLYAWQQIPELQELTNKVIDQLCTLYKNDIDCFPYDVPECNKQTK